MSNLSYNSCNVFVCGLGFVCLQTKVFCVRNRIGYSKFVFVLQNSVFVVELGYSVSYPGLRNSVFVFILRNRVELWYSSKLG